MGRTNFKKTYFVQRLAVNNMFGKLYQAEWISQISLTKNGEAEIQSCFDYSLEFHYLKNINKFDSPLKEFKLKTGKVDGNDTNSTNRYGENETGCLMVWTKFQVLLKNLMILLVF